MTISTILICALYMCEDASYLGYHHGVIETDHPPPLFYPCSINRGVRRSKISSDPKLLLTPY